jgi:rubrerythrin
MMSTGSRFTDRLLSKLDRIDERTQKIESRLERIETRLDFYGINITDVTQRVEALEKAAEREEGRRQGGKAMLYAATSLGGVGAGSGIYSIIQQLLGG